MCLSAVTGRSVGVVGRDVKVREQQGVGPANFQRALSRKILKTTKLGTRVCYKEKKHCVSTSHPKGAQDRPCYHVEFHACASLSSSCQPEPEEVQQKSRRKEEVEHRQWESQCVCQSKPSWYWRRAVCGLCVQSFLLPFILVPECRPAPLTLCVCLCVCVHVQACMHACVSLCGYVNVSTDAHGVQTRLPDGLKLDLWAPILDPGNQTGSSSRTVHAFNCRAISPALCLEFWPSTGTGLAPLKCPF